MRPRTRLAQQFYLARAGASLFRNLGASHSLRRWRADRQLKKALPARRQSFTRRMWSEAATALGASFRELTPWLFEFSRDGLAVHVLGQRTPFADPVSIELASAKDLTYELLARAGVRVPEYIVVHRSDRHAAYAFLETGPAPLVVKPARGGGGGRGVTPSIETGSQLERALRHAGSTSELVLVERQAVGEHFRFLLLDGEVLDVIRRGRPEVVGDGTSTIEELMFAEYERRLETDTTEGMKPFPVDLDCLFTLERQGLHLSSRPAEGATVVVKSATNVSGGPACVPLREPVAHEVVAEVRAAAAAVGVRLAGVDVVAPDVGRPLASSNGVVLEVNPIPGLQHHYNVAEPEAATRVAIPVLEALFAQRAAPAEPA
jgi:cyanophycin synthetase